MGDGMILCGNTVGAETGKAAQIQYAHSSSLSLFIVWPTRNHLLVIKCFPLTAILDAIRPLLFCTKCLPTIWYVYRILTILNSKLRLPLFLSQYFHASFYYLPRFGKRFVVFIQPWIRSHSRCKKVYPFRLFGMLDGRCHCILVFSFQLFVNFFIP